MPERKGWRFVRTGACWGIQGLAFVLSAAAQASVNIELRPVPDAGGINSTFNVGVYFVSSDGETVQFCNAANIVFAWDPTKLQLTGFSQAGAHPVLSANFISGSVNGTCSGSPPPPPALQCNGWGDGNAYFRILGNFGQEPACCIDQAGEGCSDCPPPQVCDACPCHDCFEGCPSCPYIPATPNGQLMTTFTFKALANACGGTTISVIPSAGSPAVNSVVLYGPGIPVTGTLGSCTVFIDGTPPTINSCAPAQDIPASNNCQGVLPDLTGQLNVSDNCVNFLTITQTPSPGTLLAIGPHNVSFLVTDPGGFTANCSTVVTVVPQSGPAIVQCAPDQTIAAGANCQAAVPNMTGGVQYTTGCSPPVTVTQSPTAGTMLGLGMHTITFTVTDASSNSVQCQATLTIADQTGPNITQCAANQQLVAGPTCEATLPDLTGQVTANDPCSPPVTITQSPMAGATLGLGPQIVTLTATDAANNQSTCQATVTVVDQTPPNISQCAPNQQANANASCQAAVPDFTAGVSATDNCTPTPSLTITQLPTAGTLVGVGPHNVTLTVTDQAGQSAQCVALFTVVDATPPSISQCAADQPLAANASCMAVLPDLTAQVTATDNCGPPSVTQSPIAGTSLALGPHTITFTATDGANNLITCQATVTVVDQTPPSIGTCAPNQQLVADASCQASLPDLTAQVAATDNCGTPTVTQSPAPGTMLGLGGQLVTFTATDGAGLTAQCSATVTVVDQTAPNISQCAANQQLAANASCQAAVPDLTTQVTATDNCTPTPSLTITQLPTAGTLVGLGPTVVTLTVADAANNQSTCQATLTVTDQSPPTISGCPADIGPVPTDPGQPTAVVNWTPPTAADNCAVQSFTSTHNPGFAFPVGMTSVTYTATDGAGLMATCSFTVTVQDTERPVIEGCPATIMQNADPGECDTQVSWTAPTVNDNLPGATIMQTQGPPSGSFFPVGTTTIVYTANDGAGNMAVCTFDVIVVDDQDPQIAGCPGNIAVGTDAGVCTAVVSWTAPTASDNCAIATFTSTHAPGATFPQGPTLVTYTATDVNGRMATCSFTVTVTDDEAPNISQCAPNQQANANAACQAAIPSFTAGVTATDNCTPTPSLTITQLPTAGTLVGLGPHNVTLTVTDQQSLSSQCVATFTVVDATPPSISQCAADQQLVANASCEATLPDLTAQVTASDNCGPATVSQSPAPGTVLGLGPHSITFTATDGAGLTAQCSATVTVVDQTAPSISQCAASQTIPAGANCMAQIPDLTGQVTATESCSPPVTVTQSPTAGTPVGPGPHTVTLTAADAAGNQSTCEATITVTDQTPPSISQCAADQTIPAGPTCEATLPDLTAQVTAADNCGAVTVTQSPPPGTVLGLGGQLVTFTVTDGAGLTAQCTATITVADQTPPVIAGCPANINTNVNMVSCQATATWTEPTASDNCPGVTIQRTAGPAPGSTFPSGVTPIQYTATDGAGLTSLCSFTVTVTPLPDINDDAFVDNLDVPLFAAVLVGNDTTPLRVARSDANCDGLVNGKDVKAFVEAILP